jgi:molybdate transport system ATP-binding protein
VAGDRQHTRTDPNRDRAAALRIAGLRVTRSRGGARSRRSASSKPVSQSTPDSLGPFTLEDIDLDVAPGVTILFGPSGAGKSTVLQAIAGLVRPQAGRICLGPEVWSDAAQGIDMPVHRRHVAYVFQSLALFPHMTAAGNVGYGLDRRLARGERRDRALQLLSRVGAAHLSQRKPRTFSGGEAQRVALARALAIAPRVVLLDEPFSALDRDLRTQLAGLVRELVDEYRLPVIHVTHDHAEARALGDRLVRLQGGRIIAQGPVAELLAE